MANYQHSIVNVTASVLKHFNITHPHPSMPVIDDYLKHKPRHITIVLLDGFGHNLLQKHLDQDAFLARHNKAKITSVFPSTTAAATTSVLTGLTPYETGYLGWFQYFKDEDLYYTTFMNEDYYQKEKPIPKDFNETHFKREHFIEKIQKQNAVKGKTFFPFPIDLDGYKDIEDAINRLADYQHLHDQTINYLYITEPDLTEHKNGVNTEATKTMVHTLNQTLESLAYKLPENSLVLITADHGLTDVTPIKLFDYKDITKTFKHNPSIEPRATSFSIKEGEEETFETLFNQYFSDAFTLYNKQSFLDSKMLGYGEKHRLVDYCLGNYFSVAKSDKFFALDDHKKHLAHHAGITPDEMEVPLIIFNTNEVK